MFVQDFLIRWKTLLRDDFNRMEIVAQSRAGNFRLLIDEIAFGNQQENILVLELLQGIFNMLQQLYRCGEHFSAKIHDLLDLISTNPALGELD